MTRPARASAPPTRPDRRLRHPQLGPGEDRVITIQSITVARQRRHPGDNLALSSNTLPFAGVFSFEPDFENNDDLVTFTPGTVDVGIEKMRVGSGTVPVGGEAVFRLVARNDGDVPGTGIEVRDTLPAGLTPVAAGPAARSPARTWYAGSTSSGRRAARLRGPRARRAGGGRPDADQSRDDHGAAADPGGEQRERGGGDRRTAARPAHYTMPLQATLHDRRASAAHASSAPRSSVSTGAASPSRAAAATAAWPR